MAVVPDRLSAEQYLALADDLPRFTQLIDGEIVVNQPSLLHQHVVGELYVVFREWIDAEPGRGQVGLPADVVMDDWNVFAPDVWWSGEGRKPGLEARRLYGPPDLAVEVRSPSTWRYDVHTKMRTYEQLGLPELWLVDTNARTILVFRRSSPEASGFDLALEVEAGETLTSPLLPGFGLDVGALFPA